MKHRPNCSLCSVFGAALLYIATELSSSLERESGCYISFQNYQKMKWRQATIVLLVLYAAYLCYIPIPENINEKYKYRILCAFMKFTSHVVTVQQLIFPGVLRQVKTLRAMLGTPISPFFGCKLYSNEVKLERTTFDGVKVNLYTPPRAQDGDKLPGFVYIHGGALAMWDPDFYDGVTGKICEKLNAVVVSVNYRRTPEYAFPVHLEDSFRAVKWFLKHADQYGVDPGRVAVAGDSAGGYLTAAVTHAVHDDSDIPNFKLQVLIYPWLQLLDLNTPSYQLDRHRYGSNGILTPELVGLATSIFVYGEHATSAIMDAFLTNNHTSKEFRESAIIKKRLSHSLIPSAFRDFPNYTPPSVDAPVSDVGAKIWAEFNDVLSDPRSCPLIREDLSGLPITFLATMEYDPKRDDGIRYAKLLEQAGVDVTWRHYENGFHGMFWVGPDIVFNDGQKLLDEIIDFAKLKL